WTLPDGDADFSKRWGIIKNRFTQSWLASGGMEQTVSRARQNNRRRGIWQRRFWEHTLRDDQDYARHFDYLHFNPVKHGLVANVIDWPYSTFHRCLNDGIYPKNWGSRAGNYADLVGLQCEGE
ncbi:MAG: REP-associated tyrosine transposase, partial [Gammaproteobacteria bacterium]